MCEFRKSHTIRAIYSMTGLMTVAYLLVGVVEEEVGLSRELSGVALA